MCKVYAVCIKTEYLLHGRNDFFVQFLPVRIKQPDGLYCTPQFSFCCFGDCDICGNGGKNPVIQPAVVSDDVPHVCDATQIAFYVLRYCAVQLTCQSLFIGRFQIRVEMRKHSECKQFRYDPNRKGTAVFVDVVLDKKDFFCCCLFPCRLVCRGIFCAWH